MLCGLFFLFRSITTVRCDDRWGWRNFFFSDSFFFYASCLFHNEKAIETRIFPSAWAIIMKRSWIHSWRENFPSEFSPVPPSLSLLSRLLISLLIKLRLWNPLFAITINRISWSGVTTYTRKQPRFVAVSEEIITTIRRRTIFTLHSFTMSLVVVAFFFGHEFVLIRSFFFDKQENKVELKSKSGRRRKQTFTETDFDLWAEC